MKRALWQKMSVLVTMSESKGFTESYRKAYVHMSAGSVLANSSSPPPLSFSLQANSLLGLQSAERVVSAVEDLERAGTAWLDDFDRGPPFGVFYGLAVEGFSINYDTLVRLDMIADLRKTMKNGAARGPCELQNLLNDLVRLGVKHENITYSWPDSTRGGVVNWLNSPAVLLARAKVFEDRAAHALARQQQKQEVDHAVTKE